YSDARGEVPIGIRGGVIPGGFCHPFDGIHCPTLDRKRTGPRGSGGSGSIGRLHLATARQLQGRSLHGLGSGGRLIGAGSVSVTLAVSEGRKGEDRNAGGHRPGFQDTILTHNRLPPSYIHVTHQA